MTGTQGHTWTSTGESTHARACGRGFTERDDPDPSLRPSSFPAWILTLRDRGIVLTPLAVGFQIDGPADDHDHQMVARHDVALRAARGHRAWWDAVLGRAPITPDLELPTIRDDQAVDGIGWPCTTCARPAPHLDHQLLAWCDRHHRPEEH